jgi:hypothetical protein
MTVNRRTIASVVIGLGLALGGCSPTSPTPPPKPTARVAVTASSVTKATIEPEKFSYTFRLQLTDSGGVSSTVTNVDLAFDGGWGYWAHISGDELGQNRRFAANGTLDLELMSVPDKVGNTGVETSSDVDVEVYLTDDNGNRVRAYTSIDTL